MRELTISTAPSRFSKEWAPRSVRWEDLVRQLSRCRATKETGEEYRSMSKDERAKAKDVGGFVGGFVEGQRVAGNVASRSLVTLDIDYARRDTIATVRELLDGSAWCLYATHSHTPEHPRYRLVAPLDRDVSPLEYLPIARRIADYIGIDTFDDSTYEPHRLMYWPSLPKDVENVFLQGEGDPLSADGLLGTYADWRNPLEYPLSSRQKEHRGPSGRKQEDPTTKGGLIGAFCRIYSVSEAIAEFLPEVYEPTATPGRYTYTQGSTAGGLVVYEDKWAYSHHGTDPIGGREVNAFDLVRIHKFGQLDEGEDEETPVTRLPSFGAMEEFAGSIPKVKADAMLHGGKQSAEEAFGDDLTNSDTISEDWKKDLYQLLTRKHIRTDKKGNLICDPFNVDLLLKYDPHLKDTVKYDEFADRAEITRDLPWRKVRQGECWDDTDDKGLLWYMSAEHGLSGKQTILDAHDLVMKQSSYHPVRDYLNGLVWDGTPRLDTMLVDYLNAEDTPLVRAMTRKHMVAGVARIMRPGEKYDYALTLSGPEGIGKTTIIKKLGMRWYSNSFSSGDVGNKESMEQVRSQWQIELGELVSVKKNTNEAFKNFLTTNVDKYRPAYARKASEFPRQCVFWATTNERYYLKGDTGNRRFWTVYVRGWGEDLPVKDVFTMSQADVDQLWAEAVVRWKQGEKLYLEPELDRLAREQAEAANEISGDERIGVIEAFIRRPIPADWQGKTRQERADWFRLNRSDDTLAQGEENRRKFICAQEVANELFQKDMSRYEMREINQILNRIKGLRQAGPTNTPDKAYGCQRRYEILPDFWLLQTQEEDVV